MRKLVVQMQCTMDGYVGAPDGDVMWAFPDFSSDFVDWVVDRIGQAGAHLMGSVTYHEMASHWPISDEPYAPPMNNIPKIVFSNSLEKADWAKTTIVAGDAVEQTRRLKQEPGKELLVHGGAGIVRTLTRAGLVDEYRLFYHPVALGAGRSIFDLAEPVRFKPTELTRFESGLFVAVFQRQ
jgi:dihydrofolate reductase